MRFRLGKRSLWPLITFPDDSDLLSSLVERKTVLGGETEKGRHPLTHTRGRPLQALALYSRVMATVWGTPSDIAAPWRT